MSMSILDSRLQFVNGLPNSTKTEAKGVILVGGLRMRLLALPAYRLILTDHSLSQVCVGTRKWAEFRYTHVFKRD